VVADVKPAKNKSKVDARIESLKPKSQDDLAEIPVRGSAPGNRPGISARIAGDSGRGDNGIQTKVASKIAKQETGGVIA
jgi:hypothetical protein